MNASMPNEDAIRDQVRRVMAAADGFDFGRLEPHDYQEQATAVLDMLRPLVSELGLYRALELGTPEGRVSAKCEDSSHPVWLRDLDDVRGCPWCRIAELEAQADKAAVLLLRTMAPDPLAYGPTGYRCGCGKDAHSNLTPCQPMTADEWNARYPVGTPVTAYPITRDNEGLTTITRTPAWTLGHGAAVVSVEGYAGGFYLSHVDVKQVAS